MCGLTASACVVRKIQKIKSRRSRLKVIRLQWRMSIWTRKRQLKLRFGLMMGLSIAKVNHLRYCLPTWLPPGPDTSGGTTPGWCFTSRREDVSSYECLQGLRINSMVISSIRGDRMNCDVTDRSVNQNSIRVLSSEFFSKTNDSLLQRWLTISKVND